MFDIIGEIERTEIIAVGEIERLLDRTNRTVKSPTYCGVRN